MHGNFFKLLPIHAHKRKKEKKKNSILKLVFMVIEQRGECSFVKIVSSTN